VDGIGLPGGAEWVIIFLIAGPLLLLPGASMYIVAKRLGFSGAALVGWAVAYAFFGYLALFVFALTSWPSGPPAPDAAVGLTGAST